MAETLGIQIAAFLLGILKCFLKMNSYSNFRGETFFPMKLI